MPRRRSGAASAHARPARSPASGRRPAASVAATIEPAEEPTKYSQPRKSSPEADSSPLSSPRSHASPSVPPTPSTSTSGRAVTGAATGWVLAQPPSGDYVAVLTNRREVAVPSRKLLVLVVPPRSPGWPHRQARSSGSSSAPSRRSAPATQGCGRPIATTTRASARPSPARRRRRCRARSPPPARTRELWRRGRGSRSGTWSRSPDGALAVRRLLRRVRRVLRPWAVLRAAPGVGPAAVNGRRRRVVRTRRVCRFPTQIVSSVTVTYAASEAGSSADDADPQHAVARLARQPHEDPRAQRAGAAGHPAAARR